MIWQVVPSSGRFAILQCTLQWDKVWWLIPSCKYHICFRYKIGIRRNSEEVDVENSSFAGNQRSVIWQYIKAAV
jgi:hypothetical protein